MYGPLPVRLIELAGYQPYLVAMWDGCYVGSGKLHVARTATADLTAVGQPEPPLPQLRRGWMGICEHCAAPVPWDDPEVVKVGGGVQHVWNTASGKPEPGDLYWQDDHDSGCFHWDNCAGRHLHAVLPNGIPWNIDSRAANCDRPDDREHRCWVRTGEPPHITAGKGGDTCSAGAGSIAAGDYHGFLIDGAFTAG